MLASLLPIEFLCCSVVTISILCNIAHHTSPTTIITTATNNNKQQATIAAAHQSSSSHIALVHLIIIKKMGCELEYNKIYDLLKSTP